MVTRAQKVRLGVFLAISGLVLLSLLGVLVGVRLGQTFDRYLVRYKITVSGLEIGAPVKYNGVRVGMVNNIRVNPDDVSEILVSLDIEGGTPIKKDVKAIIKSVGITGLKNIELTLGSNAAPTLEPGAEIEAGESDLDFLTNKAAAIGERVEILVGQLNELTREENIRRFDRLLEETAGLAAEARGTVSEVRGRMDGILVKVEAVLDDVSVTIADAGTTMGAFRRDAARLVDHTQAFLEPAILRDVGGRATSLMGSVQRKIDGGLVERVVGFVGEFTTKANTLVDNLNLTVVQSQDDINRTFCYLLETIENLNDFSRMIKDDPSVLLYGAEFEEKRAR